MRTVHDPFGTGHNAILLGGSFPEGTRRAAEAFAAEVKARGRRGALTLGRLLDLQLDPRDRASEKIGPMSSEDARKAVAEGCKAMRQPGEARSGVSPRLDCGLRYHRTGDRDYASAYAGLMQALLEYYRTDTVINQQGMTRYDNDFRDSWTFQAAILWDLMEETGLFSDQQRLDYTNLIIRLGLECVLYQGYNRPDVREKWLRNARAS